MMSRPAEESPSILSCYPPSHHWLSTTEDCLKMTHGCPVHNLEATLSDWCWSVFQGDTEGTLGDAEDKLEAVVRLDIYWEAIEIKSHHMLHVHMGVQYIRGIVIYIKSNHKINHKSSILGENRIINWSGSCKKYQLPWEKMIINQLNHA